MIVANEQLLQWLNSAINDKLNKDLDRIGRKVLSYQFKPNSIKEAKADQKAAYEMCKQAIDFLKSMERYQEENQAFKQALTRQTKYLKYLANPNMQDYLKWQEEAQARGDDLGVEDWFSAVANEGLYGKQGKEN